MEAPAKQNQSLRPPLAALIAMYLVLHLAYSLVSPPLAGPDEPHHLQYVRSLAVNHELPRFDYMRNDFDARPVVIHTALHGPVYYAPLTPAHLLFSGNERPMLRVMRHLTSSDWR